MYNTVSIKGESIYIPTSYIAASQFRHNNTKRYCIFIKQKNEKEFSSIIQKMLLLFYKTLGESRNGRCLLVARFVSMFVFSVLKRIKETKPKLPKWKTIHLFGCFDRNCL